MAGVWARVQMNQGRNRDLWERLSSLSLDLLASSYE